jgi:hypothetical protein
MNKSNIEEAGCAVCGEITPVRNLSRVKNIKKMLHILTTSGVTRKERKNKMTLHYVNILDQFLIILATEYVTTVEDVFVREKLHDWLWLMASG